MYSYEQRKKADSLLARVKSYSSISYTGHHKPQFTVMTKGQRLIFQALSIDSEPDPDEGSNTEKLLS